MLHILNLTFRYTVVGLSKPYPKGVYIFWHRNIVPLLINRRNENIVVIISSSRDGDYIAEPAKLFGFQTARGSSSRGGSNALKEMLRLSKDYSVAITPDGPKGPAQQLKEGSLQLAYLSKLPIYAIKVVVSRAIVFNSWDRFVFPKPFAKITINYSQPYHISTKEDFAVVKEKIETFLNN